MPFRLARKLDQIVVVPVAIRTHDIVFGVTRFSQQGGQGNAIVHAGPGGEPVDAGMDFINPFTPLLRRGMNLIIVCDASGGVSKKGGPEGI